MDQKCRCGYSVRYGTPCSQRSKEKKGDGSRGDDRTGAWPYHSCYTTIRHRDLQFSSVQFSRSVVSDSLRPHELQHARPPCPSPTPGAHSNSHPSSQWCHPAISSSVVPFSSCPQSLPVTQSFSSFVTNVFLWLFNLWRLSRKVYHMLKATTQYVLSCACKSDLF